MDMPDGKELRPNRAERTVLVYRKLDFAGYWEYNFGEFSFRPVEEAAELRVVTEGAPGALETHTFIVRRRPDPPGGGILPTDNVIVPTGENIVYIPERCVKKEPGDTTECYPDQS
jgi:hypothetical protein